MRNPDGFTRLVSGACSGTGLKVTSGIRRDFLTILPPLGSPKASGCPAGEVYITLPRIVGRNWAPERPAGFGGGKKNKPSPQQFCY